MCAVRRCPFSRRVLLLVVLVPRPSSPFECVCPFQCASLCWSWYRCRCLVSGAVCPIVVGCAHWSLHCAPPLQLPLCSSGVRASVRPSDSAMAIVVRFHSATAVDDDASIRDALHCGQKVGRWTSQRVMNPWPQAVHAQSGHKYSRRRRVADVAAGAAVTCVSRGIIVWIQKWLFRNFEWMHVTMYVLGGARVREIS